MSSPFILRVLKPSSGSSFVLGGVLRVQVVVSFKEPLPFPLKYHCVLVLSTKNTRSFIDSGKKVFIQESSSEPFFNLNTRDLVPGCYSLIISAVPLHPRSFFPPSLFFQKSSPLYAQTQVSLFLIEEGQARVFDFQSFKERRRR